MKVTILGCGSSGGVPRIGNIWGAADPNEPKNRRRRCSILVEKETEAGSTNILVDTSPDLRAQLLDADCGELHGVLYTHEHADQLHGIDDLRMVAINMRKRVDVYADAPTAKVMRERFAYCFEQPADSPYKAILELHDMVPPGETLVIDGPGGPIRAVPFLQKHGHINSLGYRFGPLAYTADAVGLPEQSFDVLDGIECWIVDALEYRPHPTHAHLDLTLQWIERVRPERSILTNLHTPMDYRTLKRELPPGVEPAYDGMVIEF